MRFWRSSAAFLAFILALATLAGAVFILDRVISRSDRIEFAFQRDCLQTVRDALMRYEYDKGSLPPSLDVLVPAYLRRSQIETEGGVQRYAYAPRSRTVAMARGTAIRGLIARQWAPEQFIIPAQEIVRRPIPVSNPPREPKEDPFVGPHAPAPVVARVPVETIETLEPPEGALVIEAEHYSELNWGWEVHRDENAGGGAYIICKEGTTTGSAQCHWSTYDFYNVREGNEQSVLKYHFYLPEAGEYYVRGRLWATCTHCSNSINVGVDAGGLKPGRKVKDYYGKFMGSSVPFRWRWGTRGGGAVSLEKGDHYLYLFPHEDGIHVDQLMLVPKNASWKHGSGAYRANSRTNDGTAFGRDAASPVHLTFDLTSMVVTKDLPAECNLAVRRIRVAEGQAAVNVTLREAGPDGADLVVGRFPVDLANLQELSFFELDFSGIDYAALPRREYLLTAEMTLDGKLIGACRIPLMHPYRWEVSGMMQFLKTEEPGPLDGAKEQAAGAAQAWQPFRDTSWTPLGVMDFGVQTVGNSLHAPAMKTIYARTVVEVPETDVYILKAQSDDQMILWIDGKEAERITTTRSVIRNARRWRVTLEKGVHHVRMRVNQGPQVRKLQGGYWQASLRFRTKDDDVSNVTGK